MANLEKRCETNKAEQISIRCLFICTYMARRRSGRDGSTLCGVMTKSTETDKASLMLPQDQEFRLFRPIRLSARIIIHGLADAEVQ